MRSVKFLVAAGAASLLSSAAFAADMPSIMPPPQPYYAPPPQQDFGGWYLRGDIGMTNSKGKLHDNLYDTLPAGALLQPDRRRFTGGTSYGVGVGYQFNSWFRADITGEYRSRVTFSGTRFRDIPAAAARSPTSISGGYYELGRTGQRLCRSRHLVVPDARSSVPASARAQIHDHRSSGLRHFIAPRRRPATRFVLRQRRFDHQLRMGGACRCRLQGHQQLHGRTGVPLSRHGHRGSRLRQLVRRQQCRPVHLPVPRSDLAGC